MCQTKNYQFWILIMDRLIYVLYTVCSSGSQPILWHELIFRGSNSILDQKTRFALLNIVNIPLSSNTLFYDNLCRNFKDGIRRFREGSARCKLRLDRRYILSSKRKEKLSVALTEGNQLYISYDNIKSLSQLATKTDWKTVSSESIVSVLVHSFE